MCAAGGAALKIATWNINGIKARLEGLTTWLDQTRPDIVCLQETKCADEAFPAGALEALGYNVAAHGQKGFNGVAILSRLPFDEVRERLPGDDGDEHARFLEVVVSDEAGGLRIAGAYMPNGNPPGTDRFAYKLEWLGRLESWLGGRLTLEEPLLLAGDFNIIPEPADAMFPSQWTKDALFQPESRAVYRRLLAAGMTDAVRAVADDRDIFTFWDYQAGAWQKNNGIRIDHILLSPEASDVLGAVGIDKHVRAWERPSDHVPVWAEINRPAAVRHA